MAKTIPEFYFGRFDDRFPHFAALQNGTDFTIVEMNGAGAEATCIWDSKTSLSEAYRKLIHQFRILFEIGSLNRDRGSFILEDAATIAAALLAADGIVPVPLALGALLTDIILGDIGLEEIQTVRSTSSRYPASRNV